MEPTAEQATTWWDFVEGGGLPLVLAMIVAFIVWLTPKFLAKWGEHIKVLERISMRLEKLENDKHDKTNT